MILPCSIASISHHATATGSLAIFNLLAWGIHSSRSGRLRYITKVRYQKLSSIFLPVWKNWRMMSLTISPVPLADRIQEPRVKCLKPPSLAILTILLWNYFCRLAVPSTCCSRNLGDLANSLDDNSLVSYMRVPWHKRINSTPDS